MPFAPTEAKEKVACMITAANFPPFHPSSQSECALSGLLLWCCIRQLWNNNLKTALKTAKGKASSCYCAICGEMPWLCREAEDGHISPQIQNHRLLGCLSQGALWKAGRTKAPSSHLNRPLLWVQRGWLQPCQSCRHMLVLNNGGLSEVEGGGKLFVCAHLSIRELKLGMRDTQGD